MRAVKTRNTGPELRVRSVLRGRWRYTQATNHLPGRPDFVLPDHAVAVFVDGCFWHGCPTHFRLPKHNREWWREKIARNVRRDARQSAQLRRLGYSVVRLREHDSDERVAARVATAVGRSSAA